MKKRHAEIIIKSDPDLNEIAIEVLVIILLEIKKSGSKFYLNPVFYFNVIKALKPLLVVAFERLFNKKL